MVVKQSELLEDF